MRRWRRSGKALGTVFVIVLFIAVGMAAGWYFYLRSTPERTVTEMVEAARRGDDEMLKSLFTADSQSVVGTIGAAGGGPPIWQVMLFGDEQSEYTVGSATVDGDQAKVPLTMQSPDMIREITGADEYTMTYMLIKEGSEWRVDIMATGRGAMLQYGPALPRSGLRWGLGIYTNPTQTGDDTHAAVPQQSGLRATSGVAGLDGHRCRTGGNCRY